MIVYQIKIGFIFQGGRIPIKYLQKKNKEKLKIFEKILKTVYDLHSYEFFSYEELIYFNNDDE